MLMDQPLANYVRLQCQYTMPPMKYTHACALWCFVRLMYQISMYSHYDDVIMSAIASRITSLTIFYLIVYSRADLRKHQSSASLAFVRGIHRGPVNSPHKGSVTRKIFPFDDVIMPVICLLIFVKFSSWKLIISCHNASEGTPTDMSLQYQTKLQWNTTKREWCAYFWYLLHIPSMF